MVSTDEGVTLGELHRRITAVETDMRSVQTSLAKIETMLACQSIKVRVVWASFGVAGSALGLTVANILVKAIQIKW